MSLASVAICLPKYAYDRTSAQCWNNCVQQLGPFQLNIKSAQRKDTLVIVDIGWDEAITNASQQCLVTWEVSGGGLMGNLLTDSSSVELSLWLDTVYHVQVTCKHKETGGMRRSDQLIVDTHKLTDDSIATGLHVITLDTTTNGRKSALPNMYAAEEAIAAANSGEVDSRMRILKDSSKDFLSPYNPNAAAKDIRLSQPTKVKINTGRKHYDAAASNSVLDTHADLPLRSQAAEFLTESIVFAIVGSLLLFFGLLVVYALTRPISKELRDDASANDKEFFIQNEMLPSQTPVARAAESNNPTAASYHHATPLAVASLSTTDSRTLHV